MVTRIAIGEKYPLFEKSLHSMQGQDGSVFEAMPIGDGYLFTLFLNEPTKAERDVFSKEEILVRLLTDRPFCLPLIQFGHTRMMFEMSLDPTLYPDKRATQFISVNNLCTLILVDSQTGMVHALRSANFPLRMSTLCTQHWEHARDIANYSARYLLWLQQKQTVPLEVLWEAAVDVGKMGESFDVHEIKKATE